MRKRHLLASALSVALLAAALPGLALAQDDDTATDPVAAEGVEWLLDSYAIEGAVTEVPDGIEATLLLEAGEVNGSAGCNSYFGTYEIDAETISFGPLGSTLAFCEGPMQDVEDVYLPLLQAATGWAVADEVLSLSDADGVVTLIFDEAPVVVTASDIDALTAELASQQAQIDALAEDVATTNLDKTNDRVAALEDDVAKLEKLVGGVNVPNQKARITDNADAIAANTAAIAKLDNTVNNLRDRIKTLEATAEDHEARITALESPEAEQPLP